MHVGVSKVESWCGWMIEQVEADLERLDQQKRQLRSLASKVKALTLADKSNLYDEREHDRTRKRHMDNVEMFASKHSQEVSVPLAPTIEQTLLLSSACSTVTFCCFLHRTPYLFGREIRWWGQNCCNRGS